MFLKLIIVMLCVFQTSFSQENYNASLIPEELKESANAVVRRHNTTVEILALDEMIISEYRVVTVLNRFGDKHMRTHKYYDDSSRSILKMSVLILDTNGVVVKKYKKSDFKDVSAVSNGQMYMDDRVKYLEYLPNSYPYTVVFESKIKERSTTHIGGWSPIEGYYIGLEQSTYNVINNTSTTYRFKGYNLDGYNFSLNDKGNKLHFSAENLKAIEKEQLSPDFFEIMPLVRVALNEFELKGKLGVGKNWKEFGLWQYQELLTGRDVISESTKRKITALVADAPSKKEKVKRIYNYVQENTRYVGVQLGIGGWQPIDAEEVDRVKYGDCKGLTNYTKALLKSQQIESYYALVHSGETKINIDRDFTSLQGNHVFLNVPLEAETIWLECTSQTIPFGFLGDFTDDRDVLIIKPEGGEIVHTPVYNELKNTLKTNAHIQLVPTGGMQAKVSMVSEGLQYNDRYQLKRISIDKQENHYLNMWNYLNGIKLSSVELKDDKSKVSFNEELTLSATDYTTKVGDRLLVPINPFNRYSGIPEKYEKRKLPFQTSRSFSDIDVYVFEIPKEYSINGLPENYKIDSEFGSYSITIEKIDTNNLKYTRELTLKEGVYSKENYNAYRAFIKKIVRKDKSKFILTK